MALKKKKKTKPKKVGMDMTLWGVVLSYPDLHQPKPFKGKTYYSTDLLFDLDDPQLKTLRTNIKKVKADKWGPDETEWPEFEKPFIQDGNSREDQASYKDKKFIKVSTQQPVPVVDLKGKAFSPATVRGGMFANVAIRIATWENEGDEGMSLYLQGVQIDTSKPAINFGGGKSIKQMFNLESSDDSDSDDEEDDTPRGKKKKTKMRDMDDEDDTPPKSKKKKRNFDEDDDEEE